MSDFLDKILEIKSSKPYIDYYKYHQGNLLGITKVSRWELVHSNFIAWALTPHASHSLGVYPLRQFMRCLCKIQNKPGNQNARKIPKSLMYQLYDDSFIQNATVTRERANIDLVIEIETSCGKIPIIIENKVDSGENGKFHNQTQVYFKWAEAEFQDRSIYLEPIYVFLYPEYNATQQTAKEYIRMTYQDLVDYVLDPSLAKCGDAASVGNYRSYLQCLSFQSDNEKGDHTMAISEEEKKILSDFLAKNKDLLCAVIEELDIDPAAKAAVKTGIKYQYLFDGNTYGVGPLALAVVKKFMQDHPTATFADLQTAFPDKLMAGNYGVVKLSSTVSDKHKGIGTTSPKRYFVDDAVITGIGEVVLVCSQWKKELMPKFIENADKLGYSIKQI